MSITTFDHADGLGAVNTGASFSKTEKGFFGRFLDRYIDAQMRRAQLRVNSYLQRLDDGALASLGYSQDEIVEIRRREAAPSLFI